MQRAPATDTPQRTPATLGTDRQGRDNDRDAPGERHAQPRCVSRPVRAIEDWLDLSRGLAARGLRGPLLVVIEEAPRLIRAIAELWPAADRGHCAIHRLRNILAKLPERPGLHARVRAAYWGGPRRDDQPLRG
jgi:Transposase, Mutator family